MVLIKTWQKYFLQKIFSHLLFFFLCLYGIYILIDLSLQSGHLISYGHFSFKLLAKYYLQHVVLRLDLFLSISFLLAYLSMLIPLNTRNELTALRMMGGISPFRLVAPIMVVAFFLCMILLINFEFFYPHALAKIETFEKEHLKKKIKEKTTALTAMHEDGSRLVFQKTSPEELFDIFWFKSENTIWHIQRLQLKEREVTGYFIDIFEKIPEKGLVKISSKTQEKFENFSIKEYPQNVSIDSFSLTNLFHISFTNYPSKEKQAAALTYFLFKLAISTCPLLIIFALTPFTITVKRNAKIFSLIGLAIFGFLTFHMVLESFVILGKNLVISPWLALCIPWASGVFASLFLFKWKESF